MCIRDRSAQPGPTEDEGHSQGRTRLRCRPVPGEARKKAGPRAPVQGRGQGVQSQGQAEDEGRSQRRPRMRAAAK
eukprot:12216530-Alexandrium_andersonii.AAC.1